MMCRNRRVLSAARGEIMQTAVIKRSIVLDGHKTSVSLENEFWNGLREIAGRENINLSTLVGKIDRERKSCNLSSAIRVHVFNYFRGQFGTLEGGQDDPKADVPLAARSEMAC
jgi:predicted DNA-binding ribbon-helix-helix protein